MNSPIHEFKAFEKKVRLKFLSNKQEINHRQKGILKGSQAFVAASYIRELVNSWFRFFDVTYRL